MADRIKAGPTVLFESGRVVVRLGAHGASFTSWQEKETGILVVELDSASSFDPPHDREEIPLDLLRRMTEAIEAAADEEDIEVEFE